MFIIWNILPQYHFSSLNKTAVTNHDIIILLMRFKCIKTKGFMAHDTSYLRWLTDHYIMLTRKKLFGLVWHWVSSSKYEDQHSIPHSLRPLILKKYIYFTQILRGNTSLGPVVKGLHSIVFNELVTTHSWPIIQNSSKHSWSESYTFN